MRKTGDFSKASTREYERRWIASYGFDFRNVSHCFLRSLTSPAMHISSALHIRLTCSICTWCCIKCLNSIPPCLARGSGSLQMYTQGISLIINLGRCISWTFLLLCSLSGVPHWCTSFPYCLMPVPTKCRGRETSWWLNGPRSWPICDQSPTFCALMWPYLWCLQSWGRYGPKKWWESLTDMPLEDTENSYRPRQKWWEKIWKFMIYL